MSRFSNFLLVLLLFVSASAGATTYYIDSVNGNDNASGLEESLAWQSFAKVKSFKENQGFLLGDKIKLACGGKWNDSLDFRNSSYKAFPSIITADENCSEKPTIIGSDRLNGWTQLERKESATIYYKDLDSSVSQLFVNGDAIRMARYPKSGYLHVSSDSVSQDDCFPPVDAIDPSSSFAPHKYVGSCYFSSGNDLAIPENESLSGAFVAIRTAEYWIDRRKVASNSNGIVEWENKTRYMPKAGHNYYLENKLWMLNEVTQDEWVFDAQIGRVYLALIDDSLGPRDPDENITVDASVRDYGIIAMDTQDIKISNIAIKHSANHGIYLKSVDRTEIHNVEISESGEDGIYQLLIPESISIRKSKIINSRRDAIKLLESDSAEVNIEENLVSGSGVTDFNLGSPRESYAAIFAEDLSALIKNNTVIESGYIGVRIGLGSSVIQNIVSDSCIALSDCGGIYTRHHPRSYLDPWPLLADSSIISQNIVTNSDEGVHTQSSSYGIYLDDWSNNVAVKQNTVSGYSSGILIHLAQNNLVRENTLYGNKNQQIYITENLDPDYEGMVYNNRIYSNNIFPTKVQTPISLIGDYSNIQFGSFDGNHYSQIYYPDVVRTQCYGCSPQVIYYDFENWQVSGLYSGMDKRGTLFDRFAAVDSGNFSTLLSNPSSLSIEVECPFNDSPGRCQNTIDFPNGKLVRWPLTMKPYESRIVIWAQSPALICQWADDSDCDGLTDNQETIRGTSLTSIDSDGDGLDDQWESMYETNPTVYSDPESDEDGDGLTMYQEYVYDCDPLSLDSDKDGLSDWQEINVYNSLPNQKDSDFDGLSDSDELKYGSDPMERDSDNDGVSDSDEINLGSNPVIDEIKVIDGVDYQSQEVLNASWLPLSTTPAAELITDGSDWGINDEQLIRFPLTYVGEQQCHSSRCFWNIPFTNLDISGHSVIELDAYVDEPEAITHLSLYLRINGSSWYGSSVNDFKRGWQTLRFDLANYGKDSGATVNLNNELLKSVDVIRFSPWRNTEYTENSYILLKEMRAVKVPVAVVKTESVEAPSFHNWISGLLDDYGIEHQVITQEQLINGFGNDKQLVIIPEDSLTNVVQAELEQLIETAQTKIIGIGTELTDADNLTNMLGIKAAPAKEVTDIWIPGADPLSPEAYMVGAKSWHNDTGAMILPIDFATRPDKMSNGYYNRCFWDRYIPQQTIDISQFDLLELDMYVENPAPINSFTLYINGSNGTESKWYSKTIQLSTEEGEHLTYQFDISNIPDEYLMDVRIIRFSPWNREEFNENTILGVTELRAISADNVFIIDDFEYANPIEPNNLCFNDGITDLEGVCYSTVSQQNIEWILADNEASSPAVSIANILDAEGNTAINPGWTINENGAYTPIGLDLSIHEFTNPKEEFGQILMQLAGRLIPYKAPAIAESALLNSPRIGQLETYSELVDYLLTDLENSPFAGAVLGLLNSVESKQTEYQTANTEKKIQLAHEIRLLLIEAYQLHQADKGDVVEFRGIWEESGFGVFDQDWEQTILALNKSGFNAIMQLTGRATSATYADPAMYQIPAESGFFVDQLEKSLQYAQANGISVHAWTIPFWDYEARLPDSWLSGESNTLQHEVYLSGDVVMTRPIGGGDYYKWVSPCVQEVRDFAVERNLDIADRYDVAGIHLDYIRYSHSKAGYEVQCKEPFIAYLSSIHDITATFANWPADLYLNTEINAIYQDWKASLITDVVRRVHAGISSINGENRPGKPNIVLSAAVFRDIEVAHQLSQYWDQWLDEGIIDQLNPMNYTTDLNQFDEKNQSFENVVDGRIPFYPGIGAFINPKDQVIAQINMTRQMNTGGFTLYNLSEESAELLLPALAQSAAATNGINTYDSDQDGISDVWENYFGLNPNDSGDANIDSDNDGLKNIDEYNLHTNPNNTDSDFDGIADYWESQNGLNPLDSADAQNDNDQDGLTNLEEYEKRINILSSFVQGRRVRVEIYGKDRALSMSEVEVFNTGDKNIAKDKNAVQSSDLCQFFLAGKAVNGWRGDTSVVVDGQYYSDLYNSEYGDFTATFSWPDQRYHFWEVDLEDLSPISRIKITNRIDCCQENIDQARVTIVDDNNNIVWKTEITSIKEEYEFNVEKIVGGDLQPANQLLNTDFSITTAEDIPDYWGVSGKYHAAVEDAHLYYKINDTINPPAEVAGVSVVEITNAENENGMGFYHLNFYPYQKVDVRPSGYYTFSFYLKADREAEFRVAKTTNLDTIKTFTSTTEWVRYDATSYWDGAKVYVAPGLWFPRKGTFYIAAPQLEQGDQVSPYHSAPVDMVPNTSYIDDVEADIAGRTLPEGAQYSIYDAANASLFYQNEVKAQFEYDYYTEEDSDIVLSVDSNTAQSVNIVITSEYGNVFTQSAELLKGQNIIQMPITVFAGQGNYYCSLVNNITNTELATAKFKRIPANDNGYEVRLNRLTGAPEIKTQDGTTKPFYIQGISEYGTPDNEWYYQDLVDHGINTIVIFENMGAKSAPDSVEAYKEELDKALTHAHNVGLKVILGYAWAGLKSGTAYNVNRFYQLVDLYKDNTDVIAWYVLDEFRSDAEYSGEFSNGDLIDIYNHIKGVDPYRPVLLNWSGNMGDVVGQEPHTFYRDDDSPSVFEATDIYSRTGSYPFTRRTYYKGSKLSEYVKVNITAQRTAKAFNKGAHGWIQMWGFYDAWREPSVPEYRYMAYLNVIYGSMYSYFGKPFSTHSWDNISEIQKETKEIAEIIFDKDSQILFEPRIDSDQKNFIYTAVKDKNEDIYLIVMRNNHPITNSFDQEQFVFNPFTISDNGFTTQPHITSKYESNRLVPTNAAGLVQEYFSSWETRVYVIHNDSY